MNQRGDRRETALDNPTWTKLRDGSWGARVEGDAPPAPGESIEMIRKDGQRTRREVDQVVYSGRGFHLVSLRPEGRGDGRQVARREPTVATAVEPEPERKWSTYQQEIFDEVISGTGHLVVLARAGAGKTTTAEQAIRRVPKNKTVLFTSFARKIMAEIDVRFQRRPASNVEISGLNSYGYRQVRRAFRGVQLDEDKAYKLSKRIVGEPRTPGAYNTSARSALLKLVELLKATLGDTPAAADALIDKYNIETDGTPNLTEAAGRADFIANALKLLAACKKDTATIDFNDQIWFPIVHNLACDGFDFVFIDETQDLSPAQLELALRAIRKGGRIVAIGDDRQSIFAFRGADEDAVPHIIERLDAKILKLTISYRCAKAIAREAQALVPDFTSGSDNEGVVEEQDYGIMLNDAVPGDFILSRTNAPLVKICWRLLRMGKRATIAGRDLGKGLIQLIEKAQKIAKVKNVIELQGWIAMWARTETERLLAKDPPKETEAEAVADRVACIDTLCEGEDQIAAVIRKIEALFSDDDDETRIVCSSTHKAKGLERERCWLIRNTYMKRPGTQEANLLYVAITRAKNALYYVHLPTKGED